MPKFPRAHILPCELPTSKQYTVHHVLFDALLVSIFAKTKRISSNMFKFKGRKLSKQLAFDVELHSCIFKQGLQQQKSKEVLREEQLVSWLLLRKPVENLTLFLLSSAQMKTLVTTHGMILILGCPTGSTPNRGQWGHPDP